METWLKCEVAPGQFTGEYAAIGHQFDGKQFSLFVPEEYVDFDELPAEGGRVPARLLVEVWQQGELIVIRLPRQTLENGQFVTVRADQLERKPQRQHA